MSAEYTPTDPLGQAAAQLKRMDVRDDNGLLRPPVYELATSWMPLVCVDLVPVKLTEAGPQIGVIERATGSQKGRLAILGGTVKKNERITAAIHRHLEESLGEQDFAYHQGNNEDRPFYVAQYAHQPDSDGLFDPSKQSMGLTYLVDINDPTVIRDEASAFHWITREEIPEVTAYNQGHIMTRAIDFLTDLELVPKPDRVS